MLQKLLAALGIKSKLLSATYRALYAPAPSVPQPAPHGTLLGLSCTKHSVP